LGGLLASVALLRLLQLTAAAKQIAVAVKIVATRGVAGVAEGKPLLLRRLLGHFPSHSRKKLTALSSMSDTGSM